MSGRHRGNATYARRLHRFPIFIDKKADRSAGLQYRYYCLIHKRGGQWTGKENDAVRAGTYHYESKMH